MLQGFNLYTFVQKLYIFFSYNFLYSLTTTNKILVNLYYMITEMSVHHFAKNFTFFLLPKRYLIVNVFLLQISLYDLHKKSLYPSKTLKKFRRTENNAIKKLGGLKFFIEYNYIFVY